MSPYGPHFSGQAQHNETLSAAVNSLPRASADDDAQCCFCPRDDDDPLSIGLRRGASTRSRRCADKVAQAACVFDEAPRADGGAAQTNTYPAGIGRVIRHRSSGRRRRNAAQRASGSENARKTSAADGSKEEGSMAELSG